MCGIAGFFEPAGLRGQDECEEIAWRMGSALAHRGPDDEGVWTNAESGVGLAHRRLSILDLSAEGHQPMLSDDGRYVLSFNGEIYNFQVLRRELEGKGHCFRGHADTEVMLAAFCEWGFLPAVKRFVGMFAFALWDRAEGRLQLARDRAGEKPLYYGWAGDAFVFGSELTALRVHPHWQGRVNRRALALVLRHGYIPAPHSIYEGIYKLPPGCGLIVDETNQANGLATPVPYWSAAAIAEAGMEHPFAGDESAARDQLRALLQKSVADQMVADVPVGAFLSGGIDSSLIVALMQAQSHRPVRSFSIGFEQENFNEANFAKAVAGHLGTDHTELYLQAREARDVVPELPRIYDEPFADVSQIPTVVLCRLARQHVTVSLSGDGGDELFGGYNRYQEAARLWKVISRIPRPLRNLTRSLKSVAETGRNLGGSVGMLGHSLNRVGNLADVLSVSTDRSLYQLLMSPNRDPSAWLRKIPESEFQHDALPSWDRLTGLLERMMCLDLVCYLPDDILVKVDRAAMAVGLETRIPLLDHRIIEFAWTFPSAFRQGNPGKRLLRQILYQYVPASLVDRPKRGFGAPIAEWLRGPLREWADDLLGATRLQQEGFVEASVVRRKWQEHCSNTCDWSAGLWHVLMFQAWLDQQKVTPDQKKSARSGASRNRTREGVCQL